MPASFAADLLVIVLAAMVTACGGGSGGGGSSLPQTLSLTVTRHARHAALAWTPAATSSVQFNIYQDGTRVGTVNGSVTNGFSLAGLAPSSSYCLEVRSQPSLPDAPEDGRSNPLCFYTLPTPIADLQLSGKGKDAITLRWTTDATDASITGLRIERDGGVSSTVDATASSFEDASLATQAEYCYQVRTVNARGDASDEFRRCLTSGWRDGVVATAQAGDAPVGVSLALDAAGAPIVTYVIAAPATATSGDLWLARLVDATWVPQRITGGVVRHALAVDAAGTIHVAYTDAGTSRLLYARNIDGWSPKAVDDAEVSTRPSLVVDAAGHASVAYVSGGVKYATNRSGNWTAMAVAPGRIGAQDSLLLDSSGRAHIALIGPNSDIQLAVQTANLWSIETAFTSSGGPCGFTAASIALANDGIVHMGLTQTCHAGADIVRASRAVTGSWQTGALPTQSGYLMFRAGDPAIAAGGDGRIHIAASASGFASSNQRFLRYWTNASGTWHGHTLANDVGGSGSLRVDVSLDRHAAYTTTRDVHYLTTRQ